MRHQAMLLYLYAAALPRRVRDRLHQLRHKPDEGAVTAEYLILLAILAVAILTVIGVIVVNKLTAKANSVKLN